MKRFCGINLSERKGKGVELGRKSWQAMPSHHRLAGHSSRAKLACQASVAGGSS